MSRACWWFWRYHMFLDGCIHDGLCGAALGHVFPHGKSSKPPVDALIGSMRGKLSTTYPRAYSGCAGMASNDEDFSGRGNRALDAFWNWTWRGSKRKMSRESGWRREDDEGDWRYSPEWWGTQGGGWGRNEGDVVFEMPTSMGNGVVSVTAHPASSPKSSKGEVFSANQGASSRYNESLVVDRSYEVMGYEWRVLRFNTITRQSVAKVMALGRAEDAEKVVFLQQPNCIAFEYIKSLISSGLTAVSLAGLDLRRVVSGIQKMRILCIGLGGGSLPLFLAHNLSGASVDAVEIDPVVISAAVNTMGFPPCRVFSKIGVATSSSIQGQDSAEQEGSLWGNLLQRIAIYESDGEDFVWEQSRNTNGQYDLVFVDAYDGEDVVPFKFWDRSGHFLHSLSSVLNADHGTVVVNLHTDSAPPSLVQRLSGKFGSGYDPALPQGNRVLEAAVAYRDVLLRRSDSWRSDDSFKGKTISTQGLAFTVSVSLQGNISLVVSRGAFNALKETMGLSDQRSYRDDCFVDALVNEAKNLQINEGQAGLRRHRDSVDYFYTFSQIVQRHEKEGKPNFYFFLHVKGYDTVR